MQSPVQIRRPTPIGSIKKLIVLAEKCVDCFQAVLDADVPTEELRRQAMDANREYERYGTHRKIEATPCDNAEQKRALSWMRECWSAIQREVRTMAGWNDGWQCNQGSVDGFRDAIGECRRAFSEVSVPAEDVAGTPTETKTTGVNNTTSGKTPPVWLGGQSFLVDGVSLTLSPAKTDLLAMFAIDKRAVTGAELETRSGVSDAVKVFAGLLAEPEWKPWGRLSGKKRLGYFLTIEDGRSSKKT